MVTERKESQGQGQGQDYELSEAVDAVDVVGDRVCLQLVFAFANIKTYPYVFAPYCSQVDIPHGIHRKSVRLSLGLSKRSCLIKSMQNPLRICPSDPVVLQVHFLSKINADARWPSVYC